MRRLVLLALVVPLLAGCNWANLLFGGYRGTATGHSATTVAYPSAPVAADVPRWVRVEKLPPRAVRGATVFASSGCIVCHTYAGSGRTNLNAPDLTAIGSRHLGIPFEIAHLRCPSCVNPGSPMPSFRSLGPKRLRELAIFLEASKGVR